MQVLFLHGVGEAGKAGSPGPAKPALPISAGKSIVYIDSTELIQQLLSPPSSS